MTKHSKSILDTSVEVLFTPIYTPTYLTPNYTPIYAPTYTPDYSPDYAPHYSPIYAPTYLTPTYVPGYSPSLYSPTYTPGYTPTYNNICAIFSLTLSTGNPTGGTAFNGLEINGVRYTPSSPIVFANSSELTPDGAREAVIQFMANSMNIAGEPYDRISIQTYVEFTPNYKAVFRVKITGVNDVFGNWFYVAYTPWPSSTSVQEFNGVIGDNCAFL